MLKEISDNDINEKIKKIVIDKLELYPSDFRPEARLVEDLGADGVDIDELLCDLNEAFEIDIASDTDDPDTVKDLFFLVKSFAAKPEYNLQTAQDFETVFDAIKILRFFTDRKLPPRVYCLSKAIYSIWDAERITPSNKEKLSFLNARMGMICIPDDCETFGQILNIAYQAAENYKKDQPAPVRGGSLTL